MLNTVRKTIADNLLLRQGEHVLAAVSGGPDSVALLRILEILAGEYSLKITVAHLNHGLRGDDADRDEDFVRILSEKRNIAFITKRVDVRERQKKTGKSMEESSREERYRFLYETAAGCGAEKIATGHHRDDQVETFFINLLRGAGMDGLKGIAPIRDDCLIRPLLYVSRSEILEFLNREGLAYRTDSSNADQTFLRNSIRNWLLPELTKRYNPQLAAGVARTAEIIRQEDDYLLGVVRQLAASWGIEQDDREIAIPLSEFLQQHRAIQARLIKFSLEGIAAFEKRIGCLHIEAVLELCHKKDNKLRKLDLPARILVEKWAKVLKIMKAPDRVIADGVSKSKGGFEREVEIPGTISLPEINMNIRAEMIDKPGFAELKSHPEAAFIDYDCLHPPLFIRNWRYGDRIDLLGLGGTKKLKKYFIDRKIPGALRGTIPLLVDAQSVIWIAGERISQRVRITEKTKKVLKIELV
ncbi:MAG: tRNA lysidine(34) synthetase TilS [Syntrophobacterales bacterium]|nr:tRNA lysidine(34) synthetase TilS [Syntrophobacterales bacterium]